MLPRFWRRLSPASVLAFRSGDPAILMMWTVLEVNGYGRLRAVDTLVVPEMTTPEDRLAR